MIERRDFYKKLIEAGVHFGHQASRWSPKMHPYIWGTKNKIHLIDVSQTVTQLERSAAFLRGIAASGQQILWVGTKKPAQAAICEAAQRLNMPCVDHRWVGGTLSNYGQVKKSVTRLLHDEDIITRADKYPFYTKKELNIIKKRVERARKLVGGIINFKYPIGAIVLVDVSKEESALKEASAMGIPVVGLVDTNSDPSLVDYVIPSNDDSEKSIRCVLEYLVDAVEAGIADGQQAAAQKELLRKEEAAKRAGLKAVKKEEVAAVEVSEAPVEIDEIIDTALVADLNLIPDDFEEEDVTAPKKGKAVVKKSNFEKKDR